MHFGEPMVSLLPQYGQLTTALEPRTGAEVVGLSDPFPICTANVGSAWTDGGVSRGASCLP